MAIYHLHCDIIGRSGGRSATAAAAYRSTTKIADRTTGEIFDYSRKEKALFSAILTNGNVPKWATDRAELWNSCEEKENRKNSQFCRSFDIALMKELPLEQNLLLLKKWLYQNYVCRGLVADVAVHEPHRNKDGTTNGNLHAHILIPTRKINENGWTDKDREGNDRDFLKAVRKSWADIVNERFEELGRPERIDERTLAEQGIDREPQQHQGAKATAMERKGKNPDRKKYKTEQIPEIIITDKDLDILNDEELMSLCIEKETLLAEERQKKWEETQEKALEELKDYKNTVLKLEGMTKNEIEEYETNIDRSWKSLAAVHVIQKDWTKFYKLAFELPHADSIEAVNTIGKSSNYLKPEHINFTEKSQKAIVIKPKDTKEYETQLKSAYKIIRIAENNPKSEFSNKLFEGVSSWLETSPLAKPYRAVKKAIKYVIDEVRYIISKKQDRKAHENAKTVYPKPYNGHSR